MAGRRFLAALGSSPLLGLGLRFGLGRCGRFRFGLQFGLRRPDLLGALFLVGDPLGQLLAALVAAKGPVLLGVRSLGGAQPPLNLGLELRRTLPVISVDTKKKELVGNFKNAGTDYRRQGDPLRVNVHDFEDKTLGKVAPYGVYDVIANEGWVSVGITADTAEFAVASIRCWFERMGRRRYPQAKELTITADCGGSNGARVRLWKVELQRLADETGLTIHVHHYPPGTSKWNKIEHRLFCYITQNWRGRPLTDRLAVVELIGATTTKTGLKVECALDPGAYEKGVKVSDADMASINLTADAFHPEWNYSIRPRS